jgi:predicted ester cyclase
MPASNSLVKLAEEWFQKVWNERDVATIDRLLHTRGTVDGLILRDTTRLTGPEEFKVFHRALLSAIPDFHITINKALEQDDWVAVHFTCEGTHSGEGIGVAPSNKPVRFSAAAIVRIENGQIVEGWNCVDFLGLNQQIGGQMAIG